jgi:plasmid stabilization system protein ParE
MKRVIVEDEARDEVREACAWYEGRRAGLSLDLIDEVDATLRAVSERPGSFPVVGRGARRALVRRFPYLVLFVELDDQVVVIGVFHTARQPSSWMRRAAQHRSG